MKLWYSFVKELKLGVRSFYFYIEFFMAILLLIILLFLVPENFTRMENQNLYLDLPENIEEIYMGRILEATASKKYILEEIKIAGETIEVRSFQSPEGKIRLIKSEEDLLKLVDRGHEIGLMVALDKDGNIEHTYFLQGYESEKLKNLISIVHTENIDIIEGKIEEQRIVYLGENHNILSDRLNLLPIILTYNGSLIGMFIMAAYIFLDKQEGVIKAYAVSPAPMWQYLMSKVLLLLLVSIVSTLILVIPIMGFTINYLLLFILLVTTSFFASTLGLLISSFYQNIMQAFGTIYLLIMVMIVPSIAYFIPGWEPNFLKFIPTYGIIQGFKDIISNRSPSIYVLQISGLFLIIGTLFFVFSNIRYKYKSS